MTPGCDARVDAPGTLHEGHQASNLEIAIGQPLTFLRVRQAMAVVLSPASYQASKTDKRSMKVR